MGFFFCEIRVWEGKASHRERERESGDRLPASIPRTRRRSDLSLSLFKKRERERRKPRALLGSGFEERHGAMKR